MGSTAGVLHTPDALDGTPLDLFATVYAACARNGIAPPVVDEMEVWQVASALGVGMTDDDRTSPAAPPAPGSLSKGRAARLRARAAARRTGNG